MRHAKCYGAILVGMVTAGLTASYYSSFRWTPVSEKPIPRYGMTNVFQFLAAGGNYQMEFDMPPTNSVANITTNAVFINDPPIKCNVMVNVWSNGKRVSFYSVRSINHVGYMNKPNGRVNIYMGDTMHLPRLARYTVEIANNEESPIASARLQLNRAENVKNAIIGPLMGYSISGILIGVGFVFLISRKLAGT
jgi:hypothetical protein